MFYLEWWVVIALNLSAGATNLMTPVPLCLTKEELEMRFFMSVGFDLNLEFVTSREVNENLEESQEDPAEDQLVPSHHLGQ